MNIFACDADPTSAARALPDKLMIKMVCETAQIMCDALLDNGIEDTPYKHTRGNPHPAGWAGATRDNFKWLTFHGLALAHEYERARGRVHASALVINWCIWRKLAIPEGPQTPFVQCVPDEFKVPGDPITAYRRYLQAKPYELKWTSPRKKPDWWVL